MENGWYKTGKKIGWVATIILMWGIAMIILSYPLGFVFGIFSKLFFLGSQLIK
jgi:hypothetical protein